MAYEVTFSAEAERDFELIFDFLFDSHVAFGEAAGTAIDRAEERLQAIRAGIEALAKAPHRGTRHDDILPGIRHVALGPAIVRLDLVEEEESLRVLAIFFGGQDHTRHMLARLLG
ncbi:MAG: type II toxin-antitoxin system RelE/ParE family toxin [Sneathiellaceae bacterium]